MGEARLLEFNWKLLHCICCGNSRLFKNCRDYYLTLIYFVDVDECLTSPCDDNGECTNNVGNFTCECSIGYSGNGFTCEGKIDVL